jgi:hypothetical protein
MTFTRPLTAVVVGGAALVATQLNTRPVARAVGLGTGDVRVRLEESTRTLGRAYVSSIRLTRGGEPCGVEALTTPASTATASASMTWLSRAAPADPRASAFCCDLEVLRLRPADGSAASAGWFRQFRRDARDVALEVRYTNFDVYDVPVSIRPLLTRTQRIPVELWLDR